MRFAKRFISYLVLLFWLIGLIGLFLITLVADQKVVFRDPNLEASIREVLAQPLQPLHASEVSKIIELDAAGKGITSLAGIEYLSNLTVLNLENNKIQDVSSLAGLKKLRKLNLKSNGLTDLDKANFETLAGAPLTHLNLDYNVVSPESGPPVWLSDISVLRKFRMLKELTLSQNKITDISPLSPLDNLKTLELQNNLIQDVSALQQLKSLKTLNLGNNQGFDLTPLAGLNQLKVLNLDNLPVGDDVIVLGDKHDLEELSIANGLITDIAPLQELKHLTSLNLRDNDIVDLSPLSSLTKLEYLNIQSNQNVDSILPIRDLTLLEKLDIQNVPVGEEVSALANLNRLEFLDARNCAITDTTVLGRLMANGTLQDNQKIGKTASIDLRDNPISVTQEDSYSPIREYWENIDERVPFVLPEHSPLVAPVFSASGGYYDRPFELALTTDLEHGDIYYTLDGSAPTRESNLYSAPIVIQSRVGEPNTISEIQEVSPRWIPPIGEVYKATVIRARVFDDSNKSSPIITNTFLLGKKEKYTLPVISIVTNPTYFFDHKYGIYVMGDIYDQFFDPDSAFNPWERAANYTQRGGAWERPIHIEYFDVNGVRGFSQDGNVRIQGVASREQSQKSLRFYTRCENGCNETLQYELFPGLTSTGAGEPIQEFKTFLLRNSGNDWSQTMFRDAFSQSLVEHTNLDIQAYQPTVVLLNGEYWGIHNLRERLDEYYLENHYGIAPEDVVILSELDTVVIGEAGDEQHYLDMLAFIKTHDMTDPENYAYIQTQMDVGNFIDYQISEIYIDNYNWPHANIKFWRKKTESFEPGAPYGQDGRWRWMVFDTDFSFGRYGGEQASSHDNLMKAINPEWHEWAGFLLRSLLENPEFKVSFINRFADHLNTSFESRRVLDKIDQMQAGIAPEIEEHIRRWRGSDGTLQQWQTSVDALRFFAETRPQYVKEHIMNNFGLSGTVEVHLETDQDMGYIRINSIDIIEDTPGVMDPGAWTGVYFHGVPVEISAVPYPGFRFVKWEVLNSDAIQSDRLSLTLAQDISLRAIFSEE